jgi:hypothetical protein
MSSGWRGPIPAPLGLHRVHLPYTISLLHNTLNPTVHFNGSNGTTYTRPSMVQNSNKLHIKGTISPDNEACFRVYNIFIS